MTNIDELYNEAHTHMLAKQHAITCYNPRHPCHSLTTRPLPHRPQMKPDLFYKYENQLPNRRIEEKEAKILQKALHTRPSTKSAAVSDRSAPPEIHETESSLPRVCRTRLAQLRNGYCRILNSYMSRINEEIENICPNCNNPGHTTQHLFDCAANTTDLTVDALWKQPVETSTFLRLEDDTEI